MKKSCITLGVILVTFFPVSALASDTISVSNAPMKSEVVQDTQNTGEKLPTPVYSKEKAAITQSSLTLEETSALPEEEGHLPVIDDVMNVTQEVLKSQKKQDSVRQESNPLLEYIQNYNIYSTKVYPKPERVIQDGEELDFPKMSPLFMPLVFNANRREYKIFTYKDKKESRYIRTPLLDSLRTLINSQNYIHRIAQSILQNSEIQQIGKIKYDQKNLPEPEQLVFHLNSSIPAVWSKPFARNDAVKADTKVLPKTAYNPWSKGCSVKLQFSQTYNSPNWSKGGESNMAGMTTVFMEANYSNLKNIQFDNNLEAKIGLNTVSSDSLRNLNVSTDQLKATTKLGVRMYNDWYYSLSGEFTTQFLNNYKPNTMKLKASFLSPAKLFLGLGVDYKKSDKKKGYNLSVILAPMTCKLNYLKDIENFKPASYGIDDGRHLGTELGSKVTATLTWNLSDQVQWRSKFYYFTDFTYIDSEWENTLDLNLNHYFTTTIFLHLKYDDRLKPDPGQHLLQMQELLSFGMVYRW